MSATSSRTSPGNLRLPDNQACLPLSFRRIWQGMSNDTRSPVEPVSTNTNPASPDPLRLGLDSLGVSPARLELLQRLGLETVGDLLFHFPRAYEDLTEIRRIAEL